MKIKLFIILFVPLFSLITILGLIDWISYYPKLNKEYQTIVNYGYLGSFLSGTLGIAFTASTLVFLAKTLNFERRKSDQDNFDSRFFLMLGTLENIKYKIDEHVKNEILKEINQISEFTIEETLVKSKRIIHKNNSQIGHYFRMLYQILKMIDQNKEKISEFRNVEITYYTNILRSTLDFKLTQILAINTYCSKKFDSDYKDYMEYTRKYNFFEHMPFCIDSKHISESLLAVYLNCPEGFGENSFLKKMNRYILNSIKSTIKCGYNYDLTSSYLKRISGKWSCDKDMNFDINLKDRKLIFEFLRDKISIELLTILPDSEKIVKCSLFNANPYSINSYFDENLNFLIEYEDNEYDFRCANADINSMKKIEFVFISSNSKSLDIKVNCEHIFQDYPIYLDKSMSRLTSI